MSRLFLFSGCGKTGAAWPLAAELLRIIIIITYTNGLVSHSATRTLGEALPLSVRRPVLAAAAACFFLSGCRHSPRCYVLKTNTGLGRMIYIGLAFGLGCVSKEERRSIALLCTHMGST